MIPFKQMLYYEAVKIDGPQKKILEFNTALTEEGFTGVLVDKELTYFDGLCKVLSKPEFFHSSEVEERQLATLNKVLEFPLDKAFPGIDLFRIFLLHNSLHL